MSVRPTWSNFFIFMQFSRKNTKIIGWCPRLWVGAPFLDILNPPLKILLKFTHITVDFDMVLQCFLGVEEFVADPALLYPLDPIFLLTMETHVLFEVVLELRREVAIRAPVKRKC